MSDPASDAASGFERARRTTGLFLGPLTFLFLLVLPSDLEAPAHRLGALFGLVVVFWITEAIPLPATALLGAALTVPLGIASGREAFAQFGHPIIFVFMGSFLIAMGMTVHGLDRRMALFILSRRWVGNHPGRILLAFGAISAVLSMWMSNTATTAMMLPIGLGVLRTLSDADDTSPTPTSAPYAVGLLLMIAFSCNVGGIATPVGSPTNLVAIGLIERIAGRSISFFEWMSFGLPIATVLFLILFVFIRFRFLDPNSRVMGAEESIQGERARLGRWTAGEKVALLAFLTAVVLWTMPGAIAVVLGPEAAFSIWIKNAFPEGVSAILAASLLFIVPTNWSERRSALTWRQATGIDWGTCLLFGRGLTLGTLAFTTGLAAALGAHINILVGGLALWMIVLIAVVSADVLTEFMSNTATANMLIPIFLAITVHETSGALLPAIAATLGCSLAFCLPVATPPNAIVYGTGRVPLLSMIRTGVSLDILAALTVWMGLLLYSSWIGI